MTGVMLCFSNMYFGLESGWVTMGSLQAAVLGFLIFKVLPASWTEGFSVHENVLLQTASVSAATMPLAAGFVGIIPALGMMDASEGGPVSLTVGQQFAWCAALAFFGVFFAVPLRRQTILRDKLRFPSGTATAEVIRVLHAGAPEDKKKEGMRRRLASAGSAGSADGDIEEPAPAGDGRAGGGSAEYLIQWRLLLWTFGGASVLSVLQNFIPVLEKLPVMTWVGLPGLTAFSWYLTPSPSYVGQGMIMGPRSAFSMLLGSVVGWAVLGPVARAAGWAPGPIPNSETGAVGWITWVSLAMMLGESVTTLAYIGGLMVRDAANACAGDRARASADEDPAPPAQQVPAWMWGGGLVLSTVACVSVVSPLFSMPVYEPFIAVLMSLLVAVVAVRALGESDLNPVSGVGKLSQAVFAGIAPGAIVSNLLAGAIAEAGAQQAGDMMQDLKTGHLLGSSPRAQFYAQLIGAAVSVPATVGAFQLFSTAYEIGGTTLPAPTARVWLDMARMVTGGRLPPKIYPFAAVFFVLAAALAVVAILIQRRAHARLLAEQGGRAIELPAEDTALLAAEGLVNASPQPLLAAEPAGADSDQPGAAAMASAGPSSSDSNEARHRGSSRFNRFVDFATDWFPSGIAMAVGMYIGPNWVIPRVAGAIIQQVWLRRWPAHHDKYMLLVASGLVLGEGVMSIVNAALNASGVPPWTCAGCVEGLCNGCP